VALSVVLLCGAGLLLHTFLVLRGMDVGYSSERLLTASTALTEANYPRTADQSRYFQRAIDGLRAIPGVRGAGAASRVPMVWSTCSVGQYEMDGAEGTAYAVTPGYFQDLSAGVRAGREFRETDQAGAPPVAMVNQAFAGRFCPGGNCVGQWLHEVEKKANRLEIVGVANNIRDNLESAAEPEIYRPTGQEPCPMMTFVVRTDGDPRAFKDALRKSLAEVDRNQPVHTVLTLGELRARSLESRQVNLLLLGAFAALALLLGTIGVYGVISYSVAQRRHEIGVRLAMGARQSEILGMVLKQGARLMLAGVAIGLLASLTLERVLKSQIWGISGRDPWTFFGVPLVLLGCGLAAALIPARRAARVDSVQALRCE
jgi:putative ABC transport system permease protein